MKIANLAVCNQKEPMGIDLNPYLSWTLESEQENTVQVAYEITVKTEDDILLFETEHVESDETSFVKLTTLRHRSRTRCLVHLQVWDNHEQSSCADTIFEMGLLAPYDWKAKWVSPKKKRKKSKPGFGNQDPATMFRKQFVLKDKPIRARLYATCHGIYQVSLNGKRPDTRYFAPEHTVYGDYLCYQTYDVLELLEAGDNVLGMYVGDGWYLCSHSLPNIKKQVHAHAVLFQLEVTYSDGSKEMICSDTSVTSSDGPILAADLFAGELYDARIEKNGWDKPAYCDADDMWTPTVEQKFGYANLRAQNDSGVVEVKKLQVKEMIVSPKGEIILDFGQVLAGVVQMCVHEEKGKEIQLDHCEVLDCQGNYFNNILGAGGVGKGCDQRDVYICGGEQEAVYTPRFTYHGFRYVRVSGVTNPKKEDFEAIVLSTEKENLGTFETSDPALNRLYENTRWSQTANMLSIPTDCPQREKAGWTGDMLVYAKTALQNEDCTPIFTRWLENMSCDQENNGVVPMVVPNDGSYPMIGKMINLSQGEKGQATSSGWGDAAVIVPWSMYEITGNKEILEQQFECMRKWCDYIIHKAAKGKPKDSSLPEEVEKYLWNTGYHYGEWLIPSQNKSGLDTKNLGKIMAKSACYTAPIFGWYSVSTFAKICEVLGKDKEIKEYKDIADRMKKAIQQGVIGPDGTMPSDLMGAYAIPIAMDLVPEEHKEKFAQNLIASIEEHDYCMDTGFLGTPFLLDALCKIERPDLAYQLLWQEQVPSWLSEVKAGATTIWENCFGYDEQGNPGNLSYNHYSFGCIEDWMFRYIGGISTDTPGYRHLIFEPKPDKHLTFAKRTYMTPNGMAACEWSRGEKFIMKVTIPCNCSGTIILPNGDIVERGSGNYVFENEVSL